MSGFSFGVDRLNSLLTNPGSRTQYAAEFMKQRLMEVYSFDGNTNIQQLVQNLQSWTKSPALAGGTKRRVCGYGCLTDHSPLASLIGAQLSSTQYSGGAASEAHSSTGSVVQFQKSFFQPPGPHPVDHDGNQIDEHPWTAHYFCSHALRFAGFTQS